MLRRITGPYNLNTYFLVCKKSRKTLIIDPGGRVEEIAAFIRENDLIPDKILLTHGHADQLFSMDAFKQIARIPYCLHKADDDFFKDPEVMALSLDHRVSAFDVIIALPFGNGISNLHLFMLLIQLQGGRAHDQCHVNKA